MLCYVNNYIKGFTNVAVAIIFKSFTYSKSK